MNARWLTEYSSALWALVCIAALVTAITANARLQKQVVETSRWKNAVWFLEFGIIWLMPVVAIIALLTSRQVIRDYEQNLTEADKRTIRSRQLTNGATPYRELLIGNQ